MGGGAMDGANGLQKHRNIAAGIPVWKVENALAKIIFGENKSSANYQCRFQKTGGMNQAHKLDSIPVIQPIYYYDDHLCCYRYYDTYKSRTAVRLRTWIVLYNF